jgi:trans-aconitate 2-methyltransferase
MWDPGTYRRFGDERSRPFFDLVGRIPADAPRTVVDLGCGPGTLTATLAQRWPAATIVGLDSSPEMIAQASHPRVDFRLGDVTGWRPGPDTDVVVSNAVLQWVPGHAALLTRWAGELPPGAALAFQVPGNFGAPSHRALRAVAASPRWADRLAGLLREAPVDDAAGYAALLTRAGCAVDAWETVYVHLLPDDADAGGHPVLRWMEGTALRPVRSALGDGPDWAAFRAELGERLAAEYPASDGVVPFPFRRVFAVARTPGEDRP